MKRRDFLKTSLAASAMATAQPLTAMAAEAPGKREFFELRGYTLKAGKQDLTDAYLRDAFIPAAGRAGIGPVGVFYEVPDPNAAKPKAPPQPPAVPQPNLFVLIRYTSIDQMAKLAAALATDAEYKKAGDAYLTAPAEDPVYDRIESSILLAFEGMPKLEAPKKSQRTFQLRTYESCSEAAGKKKIEMFNTAEIAIFRNCGMSPVFFGETIAGLRMPNLTYMLTFPDDAARKAAWDTFRKHPDWLKLRAIPEYSDKKIVSKIWNRVLIPAPYSQI